MNISRGIAQILGAVCLLLWVVLLPVPCAAAPLSDTLRRQDPRLEKTVTLISPRIYMGELLERFSEQTGAAISADEESGAADIQVTVSLRRVPLADAMDALWSLVSYQDAKWDWERTGKAASYRYSLVQPEAARLLPTTLQKQVQKEFEGQADKLLAGLKMTPDQLKEAAKGDRLLTSLADGIDDRVRPSMEIFAGLPSEVQQAILDKQQGITIPVSALSPDGRKFVHDQWVWVREKGGVTKDSKGNLIPPPEPTAVTVSSSRFSEQIAPSLNLDVGFGGGDLAGGGWMEKDWRSRIGLMWMNPGDVAEMSASARQVPMPHTSRPDSPDTQTYTSRLLQLSKAAPLSFLARLPDARTFNSSITRELPYDRSVQSYLTRLQDASIAHKWRGGILLLTHPSWLTDPEALADAPWSVARRLRDHEAQGDGFLTLGDFAWAAGRTTPAQMQALSAHFPGMAGAAGWHDLLTLYDGSPSLRPRLLSPQGDDYAGSLHAAAAGMNQDIEKARKLVADGSAARVRLLVLQHDDWKPVVREVRVQLLSGTGRVVLEQGFTYSRHQWRSSVEATDDGSQVKH